MSTERTRPLLLIAAKIDEKIPWIKLKNGEKAMMSTASSGSAGWQGLGSPLLHELSLICSTKRTALEPTSSFQEARA